MGSWKQRSSWVYKNITRIGIMSIVNNAVYIEDEFYDPKLNILNDDIH